MSVILRFRCPLRRKQTSSINGTSVKTLVPFLHRHSMKTPVQKFGLASRSASLRLWTSYPT